MRSTEQILKITSLENLKSADDYLGSENEDDVYSKLDHVAAEAKISQMKADATLVAVECRREYEDALSNLLTDHDMKNLDKNQSLLMVTKELLEQARKNLRYVGTLEAKLFNEK